MEPCKPQHCVCLHVFVHVHVPKVSTHIHVCKPEHTRVGAHGYDCTGVTTHTRVCRPQCCTRSSLCMCVLALHIHVHVSMQACVCRVCVHTRGMPVPGLCTYVHTCMCMDVCVYACSWDGAAWSRRQWLVQVSRAEQGRAESIRSNPIRFEWGRAESGQGELSQAEWGQPDPI